VLELAARGEHLLVVLGELQDQLVGLLLQLVAARLCFAQHALLLFRSGAVERRPGLRTLLGVARDDVSDAAQKGSDIARACKLHLLREGCGRNDGGGCADRGADKLTSNHERASCGAGTGTVSSSGAPSLRATRNA